MLESNDDRLDNGPLSSIICCNIRFLAPSIVRTLCGTPLGPIVFIRVIVFVRVVVVL